MDPGTAGGCQDWLYPLSQKTADDTRQDITAAANGHSGISRGIYVSGITVCNDSAASFQDHDTAKITGHGLRGANPVCGSITLDSEGYVISYTEKY